MPRPSSGQALAVGAPRPLSWLSCCDYGPTNADWSSTPTACSRCRRFARGGACSGRTRYSRHTRPSSNGWSVTSSATTSRSGSTPATSALATGGTGDVLAGVTGGLLAQGLGRSAWDAGRLAVGVHGLAAERIVENRRWRTLLAGDLLTELPAVLGSLAG